MEHNEFLRKYAVSLAHVVEIARRLHAKSYLAAFDGNISFRTAENLVAITPTACAKAYMRPEDMCLMALDGRVLFGEPSSEKWMHLEIYKRVNRAQAVVHAHPPQAIAWSLAHPEDRFLPTRVLSELVLAVGAVPIVPFQIPGTASMGEALHEFLPDHQALILARHGALAWGASLDEAYFGIERLEHAATVLLAARQLGPLREMGDEAFRSLSEMRAKMKKGIY